MKTLFILALDCWVYIRWLLLKVVAMILGVMHKSCGIPGELDQYIIKVGNTIFPSRYESWIFDNFEAYDRGYRPSLSYYLRLAAADQWIVGKDILDLGAGLGSYAREFMRLGANSVVALESQREKALYALANAPQGVSVLNANASDLPFADRSFDTVFSNTVFEHLPDVSGTLEEVLRVLRPNGLALVGFNFFHHRGGHHLFPYIQFPWPTWVASERALCAYWSSRLREDQDIGRALFYGKGTAINSLSEGAEIHLNRMLFQEFELLLKKNQAEILSRIPGETIAQLVPGLVNRLPWTNFLNGTIFYCFCRSKVS